MATAYNGDFFRSRFRTSILPISVILNPPSRLPSALSPPTRTPPLSTSKPRPSAPVAASSSLGSSAIVSDRVASTPSWHPVSPSSPEPTTTLDQIRRFLATRSDAPATNKYTTVTQRFHGVSLRSFENIMREIFPGHDAHPHHARINYFSDRRLMIITLPGLPHELMATFDNHMRESLVAQGFLWPTWKPQWLKSCGAARISLVHGRTRREMEPDGGLQILSQQLPFLLVEVADSQEYADVLEKASWMLRHSKGKIRFAILIKLVRMSAKEARSRKRRSRDSDLSPTLITKRVRTGSSEDEGVVVEHSFDLAHDSESSDLSSVASDDSLDSSILQSHVSDDVETTSIAPTPDPEVSPRSSDPSIVHSPDSNVASIPASPSPADTNTSRANPRAAFSSAFVTVLTSALLTGARREVHPVLDCVEFWPRRPGPADVFSFGWEDMPGLRYPREMAGKRFVVAFEDLHDTLEVFVRTTDPDWVSVNEAHLMGEWSDEGDSGETESAGEEEEEEEEEGSE